MTARTPQVGEVWTTTGASREWTCIALLPEPHLDLAVFSEITGGQPVIKMWRHLTPPKAEPPEWVTELVATGWRNANDNGTTRWLSNVTYATAEDANTNASDNRIGRISGTGEWVPCNGREVLG